MRWGALLFTRSISKRQPREIAYPANLGEEINIFRSISPLKICKPRYMLIYRPNIDHKYKLLLSMPKAFSKPKPLDEAGKQQRCQDDPVKTAAKIYAKNMKLHSMLSPMFLILPLQASPWVLPILMKLD